MTPLTICLIICVLTMISYVWGKIPMGLTALLSMAAFILTGCLDPKTALRVHRVEHQMGMDVAFIHMGSDDHLIISQVLGGKFFCNLQRQFRSDFSRFEGLDDVVSANAIL